MRLSLKVVSGPVAGSVIDIGEEPLVLGRASGQLGADGELSREHARISHSDGNGLTVEDLGSSNGTFVNGSPITGPTRVNAGDAISLGASTVTVVEADPGPGSRPAPVRRPALRVVEGWSPGALIALGDEAVVIGRGAAGASALGDDSAIADEHARFLPLGDGRVLVEDLGSAAGVVVGGHQIGAPTILKPGDRLEIGGSTLEMVEAAGRLRDQSAPAAGGVRDIPEGLLSRIAARAPVTPEQVRRVFLLSLGWGIAGNLLVRTLALEVFDVSKDLPALGFPFFLVDSLVPLTANTFAFYRTFRRPDESSLAHYLAPTFAAPIFFSTINVVFSGHFGAAEIATTSLVVLVPVAINATLMLRLRDEVARERVEALTGSPRSR